MTDYRGHKTLLREAELLAMSPESVASLLKDRANQSKDDALIDVIDEATERALLNRKEPLIDLAIALYGRHIKVIATLFQSAAPESPIRLGCLANIGLSGAMFSRFPVQLLGVDASMVNWLKSAQGVELEALFSNHTLENSFLSAVLGRRHGYSELSDDLLCQIVTHLIQNPRMQTARSDDWMDGYGEYIYSSVFDAAWNLALTAPTTRPWSQALGYLFRKLLPDSFSLKNPLVVAERWRVSSTDAHLTNDLTTFQLSEDLFSYRCVRQGLARLALSSSRGLVDTLILSDDVAFRAAAYESGELTTDQLREGYKKDGELAFDEAVRNEFLWREASTREALHDIAWAVVDADKNSELVAANVFNSVEREMRAKHPSWFESDDQDSTTEPDEEPDAAAVPATRGDVWSLAGKIESANGQLKALMGRTGWIWWFALGALVASARHF